MGPSVKNFVLYNVGWFATVYFAAQGQAWIANCVIALVVSAHLLSIAAWKKEALMLALAGLIGIVWETALVTTGILSYPASPGFGMLAPSWIVAMWVLFATTINVSLSWVKRSLWIAAVFGAVGGPLAFVAGKAFGAVAFGHPVLSPLVIGAGWAILLPLLCRIADAINDSALFEPRTRPTTRQAAKNTDRKRRISILNQALTLISGKGIEK